MPRIKKIWFFIFPTTKSGLGCLFEEEKEKYSLWRRKCLGLPTTGGVDMFSVAYYRRSGYV